MLLLIVGGIIVFGGLLIVGLASEASRAQNRELTTLSKLERARSALVGFVSAQGRLPCPANPAANTGLANNLAATPQICNTPGGTLPWSSLGLSAEDGLDGWGRKISYRVYWNPAGLTQFDGANLQACDTTNDAVAETPLTALPNRLCDPDHNTLESTFIAAKGLQGIDFGVINNDYAFVLISHGATGYGAWTAGGVAGGDVPAGGGDENSNVQAGNGPYVRRAANRGSDADPRVNTFYDDIVLMMRIGDLAKGSGLSARAWPD
jgi:hypothetical protein